MAQKIDFLHMTCINADCAACAICSKEFIVPIDAVDGFFKRDDGTVLSLRGEHFCASPLCSGKTRFIKIDMPWEDIKALLDGELKNVGPVEMIYVHKVKE